MHLLQVADVNRDARTGETIGPLATCDGSRHLVVIPSRVGGPKYHIAGSKRAFFSRRCRRVEIARDDEDSALGI